MLVSCIVAAAQNGVIGINGQLPWKLQEDLQYFRAKTMGHSVIMGRKTYESIGKPLTGRTNIVLTRQKVEIKGCFCVQTPDQALKKAENLQESEVFVVGGAQVYQAFMSRVNRIYLTEIEGNYEGDSFFRLPNFKNADIGSWQLSENGIRYAFHTYEI